MKLDKEELELLELLGNTWAPLDEIAIILNRPYAELLNAFNDKSSEFYQVLMKHRLLSKAEVHKNIFHMAKAGSTQAQQMVIKHIEKTNIDEQSET